MNVSDNSKKNLKPWTKGQSGNPAGKKAGTKNISTYLNKYLNAKTIDQIRDLEFIKQMTKGKNIPNAEAIALRLLYAALVEGDLKAIQMIQDRSEGKTGQFIDMSSDGEEITGFEFEQINYTPFEDITPNDVDDDDTTKQLTDGN